MRATVYALALLFGLPGQASRCEDLSLIGKPAPELNATAWEGCPVRMEALRGNVVLLAFWDWTFQSTEKRFVTPGVNLVIEDYCRYQNRPNVSFVSICCVPGTDRTALRGYCQRTGEAAYPFAKMADANGETAKAYGVVFRPQHNPYILVVIDHNGKIAFNEGSLTIFSDPSQKSQGIVWLRHVKADRCLKDAPGLLGAINIPASMSHAVQLYNLQQFDSLGRELMRVLPPRAADSKDKATDILQAMESPEARKIAEIMELRLAEYRKTRLLELKALAEQDPALALKDTTAFIGNTAATTEENRAARELADKLATNPAVRKSIEAERAKANLETEAKGAFERVLRPALSALTSYQAFMKSFQPLWDQYVQKYGETEYAKEARREVDARKKKLALSSR